MSVTFSDMRLQLIQKFCYGYFVLEGMVAGYCITDGAVNISFQPFLVALTVSDKTADVVVIIYVNI
jgi:hypothetical protein